MFEQEYSITIRPVGLLKGAATVYESGVRDSLRLMLPTTSGQILLNSIHYNAVRNHIQVILEPQKETCGAGLKRPVFVKDRLTGVVFEFSPDDYSDSGECGKRAIARGANGARLPNEVLFHELVHAMRLVSLHGFGPKVSGGLYKYDDFEEFCAVLATNIYISDRTNHVKSSLRRDHRTGRVLEPELSGSFTFFQSGGNTFHWVQRFCTENVGFTKALAGVKADFNPIAAYYTDPAKARDMSLIPLARQRDSVGFRQQADDYEKDLLSNSNRQPQVP
jgi:hypothetical protein